nr:uncharacterized protein LOC129478494 [Symphalangus syndactylus]
MCTELITSSALLLSCSHNFCKQCLELILVCQNCTQVQGRFCCPVCRKDIYLKGKRTNGLQGNILAENILEKLKEVLETLHTGEQNQLTQMCEKRGEIMNLMCLSDEKPICRIFKLSGDHSSHQVAKIADVYTERKAGFAENIQQVLQRSESTAQETEDTARLIRPVHQHHQHKDHDQNHWKLPDQQHPQPQPGGGGAGARACLRVGEAAVGGPGPRNPPPALPPDTEAPAAAPECNTVSAGKDKKLRTQMKRFMHDGMVPQVPEKDNVSIRHYFQELIKGIDIAGLVLPELAQALATVARLPEACRTGRATQSELLEQTLQEILCKSELGLLPKPNKEEPEGAKQPPRPAGSAFSGHVTQPAHHAQRAGPGGHHPRHSLSPPIGKKEMTLVGGPDPPPQRWPPRARRAQPPPSSEGTD